MNKYYLILAIVGTQIISIPTRDLCTLDLFEHVGVVTVDKQQYKKVISKVRSEMRQEIPSND